MKRESAAPIPPRSSERADILEMAAALRRREAEICRRAEARADLARLEVGRLKDAFLAIDPDIERIVLFGSLLHRKRFRSDSDIDLAVRCRPESYLALVAEALRSPFPVDVIDLASVDHRILEAIEREGEVIHAK